MCRIFGYISNNYMIEDEIIERVKEAQLTGGPDEQIICRISDSALIANNRLNIQDITRGKQPFILNNVYAVFNGELYNHRELKYYLSDLGYKFKTDTDGEIILPLYLEYGLDFIKYLDGMFCIALYDNNDKKLIIATDSFAIKSVYYAKDSKKFCFSSDIKGIHEFGFTNSRQFTDIKIDNYLVGRSIWGDNTFFDNIKTLKPCQILVIDHQLNIESLNYRTNISSGASPYSLNEAALSLHHIMEQEVASMIKADVPSCIVLSGGLDSSYIAALMKRQVDKLDAFHVCYDVKWKDDERIYAAEVAKHIGANYHEIVLKASDMVDLLDGMIDNIGVPNTAPHSLAAYALFKHIRNYGYKVAFAGEGSDEIFCGYKRFSQVTFDTSSAWISNYFSLFSVNTLASIRQYYARDFLEKVSISKDDYYNFFCANLQGVLSPENKINKLLEIEQNLRFPNYILRRTDHLSMAVSLEVRLPFCQPKVKSFANKLPMKLKLDFENQKKVLLKAASGLVPSIVLQRKKQPFTLPVLNLLKQDINFKNYIQDNLKSNRFLKKYFAINKLLEDLNDDLDDKQADVIWAILVLGLWMNKNLIVNL
jgi:asparagine synthase (glutamine-hydrolysing)